MSGNGKKNNKPMDDKIEQPTFFGTLFDRFKSGEARDDLKKAFIDPVVKGGKAVVGTGEALVDRVKSGETREDLRKILGDPFVGTVENSVERIASGQAKKDIVNGMNAVKKETVKTARKVKKSIVSGEVKKDITEGMKTVKGTVNALGDRILSGETAEDLSGIFGKSFVGTVDTATTRILNNEDQVVESFKSGAQHVKGFSTALGQRYMSGETKNDLYEFWLGTGRGAVESADKIWNASVQYAKYGYQISNYVWENPDKVVSGGIYGGKLLVDASLAQIDMFLHPEKTLKNFSDATDRTMDFIHDNGDTFINGAKTASDFIFNKDSWVSVGNMVHDGLMNMTPGTIGEMAGGKFITAPIPPAGKITIITGDMLHKSEELYDKGKAKAEQLSEMVMEHGTDTFARETKESVSAEINKYIDNPIDKPDPTTLDTSSKNSYDLIKESTTTQLFQNPLLNKLIETMHDPEALMKAVMDVTNSPAGQELVQRGIDQAMKAVEQEQQLENQTRTRGTSIGM